MAAVQGFSRSSQSTEVRSCSPGGDSSRQPWGASTGRCRPSRKDLGLQKVFLSSWSRAGVHIRWLCGQLPPSEVAGVVCLQAAAWCPLCSLPPSARGACGRVLSLHLRRAFRTTAVPSTGLGTFFCPFSASVFILQLRALPDEFSP